MRPGRERNDADSCWMPSAIFGFDVEDEIAEGDEVVQLVTMSGTHTGPLLGRQPSGRAFAVRHIYIWRIADGKIVEHRGSRDDLGLLQQIGLLPSPAWRERR